MLKNWSIQRVISSAFDYRYSWQYYAMSTAIFWPLRLFPPWHCCKCSIYCLVIRGARFSIIFIASEGVVLRAPVMHILAILQRCFFQIHSTIQQLRMAYVVGRIRSKLRNCWSCSKHFGLWIFFLGPLWTVLHINCNKLTIVDALITIENLVDSYVISALKCVSLSFASSNVKYNV